MQSCTLLSDQVMRLKRQGVQHGVRATYPTAISTPLLWPITSVARCSGWVSKNLIISCMWKSSQGA
jgi:hypothetical protein